MQRIDRLASSSKTRGTMETPFESEPGLMPHAREETVEVIAPTSKSSAVVFASPHSGRVYPDAFLQEALVPLSVLRRSEDAYVDQLFADVPELGAPLVRATFPRVYVDPNRGPDELDPNMFYGDAPVGAGPASSRAAAGLGVIPRVAADGRHLYGRRLSYREAQARLAACYAPFHRALHTQLQAARARFGVATLFDCHSMPAASARGADIVLGDRYGASCNRDLVARAEEEFRALGFAVVRNRPYAGGHTTEHYGHPRTGTQAIQIEINRGLYLDEATVTPLSGMTALRRAMAVWSERMITESISMPLAAE